MLMSSIPFLATVISAQHISPHVQKHIPHKLVKTARTDCDINPSSEFYKMWLPVYTLLLGVSHAKKVGGHVGSQNVHVVATYGLVITERPIDGRVFGIGLRGQKQTPAFPFSFLALVSAVLRVSQINLQHFKTNRHRLWSGVETRVALTLSLVIIVGQGEPSTRWVMSWKEVRGIFSVCFLLIW